MYYLLDILLMKLFNESFKGVCNWIRVNVNVFYMFGSYLFIIIFVYCFIVLSFGGLIMLFLWVDVYY